MGPLRATLRCVAAPVTWRGRASPSEFWWFTLVSMALSGAASAYLLWPLFELLDAWEAAMAVEKQRAYAEFDAVRAVPFPDILPALEANAVGWLAYLAVSIPLSLSWFAVAVRRLHDSDHSGWWYWIALVPLVGPLFLIVLFAAPSQLHRNRFGPGPGVPEEARMRRSDLPVVPRDPLAGIDTPEGLRALRRSRMQPGA